MSLSSGKTCWRWQLLDELEQWEDVLEMAKKANAEEIIKKAEKQINKITEKMKF